MLNFSYNAILTALSWTNILGVLYAVLIISIVVLVMLENRNPIKTVSWVSVLVLLPALGLVLYFFFGRSGRRRRLLSRYAYERIIQNAAPNLPIKGVINETELDGFYPLSQLIRHQTQVPLMVAQEITPFFNGTEKFEQLKQDLQKAQQHIHLQYYIFMDDTLGQQVAEILIQKAKQGVEVRVIYDYVGSWKASHRFYRKLRKAGVEVYSFLPVALPFMTSKANYRNHRKLVIIDGEIGYIGGMNIADRYTNGGRFGSWRDTHVRLIGNAVNQLQASFVADWYVASRRILPTTVYRDEHNTPPKNGCPPPQHILIQTFSSGPTGPWRVLMQVLCLAIHRAEQSVWIQTPYFLPNEPLSKAILGAALRGVDVRITIPQHCDNISVKYATNSFVQDLLEAGVKVYHYQRGFLHAKVLTIDHSMSIVGSANMDFRSLEYNFEVNSCIYDKEFTQHIERQMDEDFDNSSLLSLWEWQHRPLGRRLGESLMRLFSPLL